MTYVQNLGDAGVVPPGFRNSDSGLSMGSRSAVQLMKDTLDTAIKGGHLRLEEVLPRPSPTPAPPRAPRPVQHVPRAPDRQLRSRTIAAGCAGRRHLAATAARVG